MLSAARFPCAAGSKGWCLSPYLLFRCALAAIFPLIFSWLEASQERRGRSVQAARLLRVHRSVAQSLDSTPALRTLASEKMGDRIVSAGRGRTASPMSASLKAKMFGNSDAFFSSRYRKAPAVSHQIPGSHNSPVFNQYLTRYKVSGQFPPRGGVSPLLPVRSMAKNLTLETELLERPSARVPRANSLVPRCNTGHVKQKRCSDNNEHTICQNSQPPWLG